VHEATEGLSNHVVRGPAEVLGVAALPVARHVRDHEARVRLLYGLVREAPLGVRSRLRALHPAVTGADQAEEPPAAVGGAQVGRGSACAHLTRRKTAR